MFSLKKKLPQETFKQLKPFANHSFIYVNL